jgi:acyl-CoA synthetase (AMP-forming)/AMP-acid ligase II
LRTIRYWIDERAAQSPEKVYLFAPEPKLELSYEQLKADSRKFGKHLLKRGLKKGDKISFMIGNGYQTTKIFLGTMYAGLVVAPLNFMAQAAQLEYVLDHSDTRLDQLRFGRSASAALPPSLHKAFEAKFNVSIVETMGLTETAAPVFSNPADPSKRKYGSPGQAVGNQAKIIDKEGNAVPPGIPGEIMIKGDNVMKGYYKDPQKTAGALEPDGWLHTGDLGYLDEDGFVFVKGRIKELIIKGGENISPREIDEALYQHPAVLDAAAVGIPDEHYGEEILCCCVLKPDCECTAEELQAHCRKHLGEFKTPKVIKVMDDLPKGPSRKIQRLKLPEMVKRGEG